MVRRWHRIVVAGVVLVGAASCSSGDGVPEFRVQNQVSFGCLIDASFLGYHIIDPIATGGITRTHETVAGTDVAYGLYRDAAGYDNCLDVANDPDVGPLSALTIRVTNQRYTAVPGEATTVVFDDSALEVPMTSVSQCNVEAALRARALFARLDRACLNAAAGGDPGN